MWTRDWRLLSCQVPRLMEEFAKSPPENVLSILLPRLVDDEGAEALMEPLSTPQQSVLLRKLGRYGSVFFGARNGKYELDLSNPLQRERARRLASRSSAERRWCLEQIPEELPAPPEGAPFILDQPPITKPTEAQKATFFGEGSEQRYGSGCLRNVSYGNIQLTGVVGDDFLGAIIEARAPRGTLRFDYSSLVPVAEGEALPNAAFRRTLNECGLPLDAVVLAGKIGRSYLESVEEDAGDAKWRARAKVIDERFLHDIDGGAHDPENPMAFLEPASPLDVGTAVAPVAAALRTRGGRDGRDRRARRGRAARRPARGNVHGRGPRRQRRPGGARDAPSIAAPRLAFPRCSPSPLCTQATWTRLREVPTVGAWTDAVEALWAELSRRESCLGVEKGKLVRVAHAVRIRVVAGDRCVLRVRGLEADEIDTRTFLGVSMPVLQKSSGRVCTQQSPAAAAAALARQAVLEPLGLTKATKAKICESWRLRGLGRAARPAPAARRRHARDVSLFRRGS